MNTQDTTNQESQATPPSTTAPFPTEQYIASALAHLPDPECQIKDGQWFQLTDTVRRRAELELVLTAAVAFIVKQDQNGGRLLALGLPCSAKLALIVEFGRTRARSGKAEGRLDQAVAVALSAIHYHDRIMDKHLRHLDRSWYYDSFYVGLHLSAATQEMITAVHSLGRDFGYFDCDIYPAMRALANRIHEIKEFPDLRVQPSPTTLVTSPTADQAGQLVPASAEVSTIPAGSDNPPILTPAPGVGAGSATRISTASR